MALSSLRKSLCLNRALCLMRAGIAHVACECSRFQVSLLILLQRTKFQHYVPRILRHNQWV
jgi:hypothetical protein